MSTSPLRIVFAGTPAFADAHLRALLSSQHQVVAVYTQPDRPAGRGKQVAMSPVKQTALAAGIPILQPPTLKAPEAQETLRGLAPDLMAVVAYGLILPQAVLDIPRLGCVNVHASLLPRWRGAAPIQRAIEAGDSETGVCIMQMEAGLDTGPVLHIARCPIEPDDTGASLHDRLAQLGPPALLHALDALAQGRARAIPQDDTLATYAHKLDKSEAALDWHQPAAVLARRIRAFDPFPGCHADLQQVRVKVWKAHPGPGGHGVPGTILEAGREGIQVACGKGSLIITELQLPNARRLPTGDVLNGHAALFTPGAQFVSTH